MLMMADLKQLKEVACTTIDKYKDELHNISQEIWNHPELYFNEHFAHKILTDFLEKHGFKVDRHYLGLDTAFRATVGEGKPHVAVLCEYDALPEIGHACGHNLIAELGVASGLGIKAAMEAAKGKFGTLTVLGTPAEETGGGKVDLLDRGAFEGIDFCGMCHPYNMTVADVSDAMQAHQAVQVHFKGKASHAAGFPWEGINALDAAVMAYNNISCLRQQMKPTWRVHGVIKDGGAKANIIPESSSMEYVLRTLAYGELEKLKKKAAACFEAAAAASGCEVTIEWDPKSYKNIIRIPKLLELFRKNKDEVGIEQEAVKPSYLLGGSTDLGNVSHVVPCIHPAFYIGDPPNHTRAFATVAGAATAQKYTLNHAKALAMTAIDILGQPELLTVINKELEKAKRADAESAN